MRPPDRPKPVSFTRRQLLRLFLALAAWLPGPFLSLLPRSSAAAVRPAALTLFVDTLLPGDGGPPASELGVDGALLKRARREPMVAQLLSMGFAWLDQQAATLGADDFASLDEAARITVVTRAEQEDEGSMPHRFLAMALDIAFEEYYAHRATWVSLGYSGPPQPRGFTGYAHPPGAEG